MVRLKRCFLVLFSMIVLPAIISSNAKAEQTGTIITRSGEEYRNVSFEVNYNYRVVTVQIEGKQRSIGFDRIRAIYDSGGNDITEATLKKTDRGMRYKKPKTKPWNIGINPTANFSLPIGSYYGDFYYNRQVIEGVSPGIGFGGNLFVALTPTIDLRATVTKAGMHEPDSWGTLSFSVWRYFLSVQYHKKMKEIVPGQSIYYAYSGLGVVDHKFKNTVTNQSSSNTKFAVRGGAGAIIPLTKYFGIDLGVDLDLVFVGSYIDEAGFKHLQNALIFDVKAGLVVFL